MLEDLKGLSYYDRRYKSIYQKEARRKKRIECVEYLGGKCVGCGTTENLQFDHIDRNTKSFQLAHKYGNSFAYLKPELDKCQLLCKECHELKSQINHDEKKLAEGYRVSSVEHLDDKILVTLSKSL